MKKNLLTALVFVPLAFGMGPAARAQTEPQQNQAQAQEQTEPAPKPKAFFFERLGPGQRADRIFAFETIVGDFGGQQVITNAPFSARILRETVQTLADGNRIDRKQTGTIARDSYGRTRRENSIVNIGLLQGAQNLMLINIHDPVTGEMYFLDTEKKTAVAIGPRGVKRPPEMMLRADLGQAESLGAKTIDGIFVQGTRYTRTIPAGKIGNEKPIIITEEKWVSPDLHITVSMTRSDPRFGTSTYQLTDISRAEPAPSLFLVPSDYIIITKAKIIKRMEHHSGSQF